MIQAIEQFFLETVGRHLCVFFCAMLPIIELRGAIPLGAGLGLPFYETLGLSLLGNMLPVPFILLFIRLSLTGMKKVKGLCKIAEWLERKAEKNREKIEKYSFWGLFLFVAVPLPGTGAWTGSLVAALIHMDFKKALASVALGVLAAGIVMTIISYGIAAIIALF